MFGTKAPRKLKNVINIKSDILPISIKMNHKLNFSIQPNFQGIVSKFKNDTNRQLIQINYFCKLNSLLCFVWQ